MSKLTHHAATRLSTRAGRREHVSPVLQELHFLPVQHTQLYSPSKAATIKNKQNNAVSTSNCQHWCSSRYTAAHRRISQTHASRGAWGQSPSPLVWRHHVRHTVVQNSSGRQVVRCRRTAALEQAACFTAVIWQSLSIQKTVKNVFVCQGIGCGARWLLFLGAGYKYSYLLTYNMLVIAGSITKHRRIKLWGWVCAVLI